MPILEDLKEYTERATGLKRPGKRKASNLRRARKPHAVRFKDDGLVPNHPRWPLIIYRGAVDLDERHDPAAVIEDLFEANGWGDTWRDGIYDYVHYHSRIHEVLGIARGTSGLKLSWPFPSAGFVLESAATLNPSNWQPVIEAPTANAANAATWEVTVPNGQQRRFFRLHKP